MKKIEKFFLVPEKNPFAHPDFKGKKGENGGYILGAENNKNSF